MAITRKALFDNGTLKLGLFEARPVSDACGEVEQQDLNAVVLPLHGVFAKHEAPGRYVIGTPSHAVYFAAATPYRLGFPGAIGDRALTFRFDEGLAPEDLGSRDGDVTASYGILPPAALMLRNLLWTRLRQTDADCFEIETCALDLVHLSLMSLRPGSTARRAATTARWARAVERVKEAVALAPADKWSIAGLANTANLSPYHLCRVFRQVTGTPIYDYVLRERLARSLDAVLDGGDLTGIALDAGFASHSHFTARFRAFFGKSPAALRQGARTGQLAQMRKIATAHRA